MLLGQVEADRYETTYASMNKWMRPTKPLIVAQPVARPKVPALAPKLSTQKSVHSHPWYPAKRVKPTAIGDISETQTILTRAPNADYSQLMLIKKINHFLRREHQRPILELGKCFGLTTLWLYKMLKGKEQWFYNTISNIINCREDQFDLIRRDFYKFVVYMDMGQERDRYYPLDLTLLSVNNLDTILNTLKGKKVISKDKLELGASERGLARDIAEMSEGGMLEVAGGGHTIGIYKRHHHYCLYDANYPSGGAKIFTEVSQLIKQIRYCLNLMGYENFTRIGMYVAHNDTIGAAPLPVASVNQVSIGRQR